MRTTQDSAGRDRWQGLASRRRIALLPDLTATREEVFDALDHLQVLIDFHKPPLEDYDQLSESLDRLAAITRRSSAESFRE